MTLKKTLINFRIALITASDIECTACKRMRNRVSQEITALIDISLRPPGLSGGEGICVFKDSACSKNESGSARLSQISSTSSAGRTEIKRVDV